MEQSYFTGTILPWAATRAPLNWLPCAGQSLQISAYQALYNLIGTIYGGDGKTTFCLPNLQGVAAAQCSLAGSGLLPLGHTVNGGGAVNVLNTHLPCHEHTVDGGGSTVVPNCGIVVCLDVDASYASPIPGGYLGIPVVKNSSGNLYPSLFFPIEHETPDQVTLGGVSLTGSVTLDGNGGNSGLNVMPPYQVTNFIICVLGVYPNSDGPPLLTAPPGSIVGWAASRVVPSGWQICNGGTMPINSTNTALFSVLGTTYGGDGSTNFGLPNAVGRVIAGAGNPQTTGPFSLGTAQGMASQILTMEQMPSHTHAVQSNLQVTISGSSSDATSQPAAAGRVLASIPSVMDSGGNMCTGLAYTAPVFRSQMAAVGMVWVEAQGTPEVGGNYSPANGQQPISTMSPCLGINYIMYVAPPSSDPSASLKA